VGWQKRSIAASEGCVRRKIAQQRKILKDRKDDSQESRGPPKRGRGKGVLKSGTSTGPWWPMASGKRVNPSKNLKKNNAP